MFLKSLDKREEMLQKKDASLDEKTLYKIADYFKPVRKEYLESGTLNITTGAVAGTTTLTFVGDQHIQTLQQVCGTSINGYEMLCFNYVGCINSSAHCFRSCVMQPDGRITELLTLVIDTNGQIMRGNSQPVM